MAGFEGCRATLFGRALEFKPVEADGNICASIGVQGRQGWGATLSPIESASVNFGVKSHYKLGLLSVVESERGSASIDAHKIRVVWQREV